MWDFEVREQLGGLSWPDRMIRSDLAWHRIQHKHAATEFPERAQGIFHRAEGTRE
jgi:hypothetical protein